MRRHHRLLPLIAVLILVIASLPAAPAAAGVDCDNLVPGANLRGCDLSGREDLVFIDFSGANLQGANLSDAYLEYANLAGANLRDATMVGVTLHGANLTGANLRNANLSYAHLESANLTNANLRNANLSRAWLDSFGGVETNLTGTNLTGVIWSNTACPNSTNSDDNGGTCIGTF